MKISDCGFRNKRKKFLSLVIPHSAIRIPQLKSILFMSDEPQNTDDDQDNWKKVSFDDGGNGDVKVDGVVFCAHNADPNNRRNPGPKTLDIPEKTSDSYSDDNPGPTFF